MKTTFTLRLIHAQAKHARDAANQAFALIDEIENALSRYISGSDVSQINRMQGGQTLFISETCYECVRIALKIYVDSDGLFDITFHYFSHCSRKFTTYYYTFSYRSDPVLRRYIGISSVYRR